MRNRLAAGAIGLVIGVFSMGVATNNIGYYAGLNQGVYAGWNTEHCVGFEFKPYTGFFVGCE